MSDLLKHNQSDDNDKDIDPKLIDWKSERAYNEEVSDNLPLTGMNEIEKYNITIGNALENARKNFQNATARMSDRTFLLSNKKGIASSDNGVSTTFNGITTTSNPSVSASFVKNEDEPLCSLCKNADICKYREKFETLYKHVMEWYDKDFKDIDPNHELFNIIISCQHFNMIHSGVRTPLQY